MIKNIIITIGYAENQSLSVLCYNLTFYRNSEGFDTKKEALHALAKDLWAHYRLVVNEESEVPPLKNEPVSNERADEFEDWLRGLPSECNDSYGYPEQLDIKHKFIWSSCDGFSFPKKNESVLIEHSAEQVIPFALYKEGLLSFGKDYNPKEDWIAEVYEESIE